MTVTCTGKTTINLRLVSGGQTFNYFHLDKNTATVRGSVTQGTVLGSIFGTGAFNDLPCGTGTAPHLHFEVPSLPFTIDGYTLTRTTGPSVNFTSTNTPGGGGLADGSFVRVSDGPSAGLISRVVGGYLFGLETCDPLGGCPSYSSVTGAEYNAYMAAHPRVADGTFVRVASGAMNGLISRAIGGYLFGLESCDPLDGCPGQVNITDAAYRGYTATHTSVADGAFVRSASGATDGRISRAAGGHLFWVSSCEEIGNCNGWVNVTGGAYEAYSTTHAGVATGTIVRAMPSGTYWRFATRSCATTTATTGAITVSDSAVSCQPLTAATPTITGTPRVGHTLTANPGTWGPAPVTLTYQWYRSGTEIVSATGRAHTLVAADRGAKITVKVAGNKDGYTAASRTSAATATVAAGKLTTATPKITGTRKVGSTLTAVHGTWGPSEVTLTYRWYRNSKRISGAIAATYTLLRADKGKRIRVKVTGTLAGYTTVTKTSARTSTVK